MRIGLVCQSCDSRTGIGRIVNSLATEYLSSGREVICAAQHFEGANERIIRRHVPSLSLSKGLSKLIFRLSGPPFDDSEVDIVHAFGAGRGAHIVSAQSCHRAGMELLRTKRRQFVERRGLGFYDRVSLADELALFTSPSTRRIIAVSRLVQSQIEEQYQVDPKKISIVPNGVDCDLFDRLRNEVDRTAIRSSFGLIEDQFVLLFVGNEFGRKGLHVLLRGIKSLNDKRVFLLVVGDGDRKSYERLAGELGISEQVGFTGSIPNPERLYFAADAFVLPTLYEPFGLVVVEAMAAGIPVITSKGCGATEGMEHQKEVYHLDDPTSLEEMTEAMRSLATSASLRQAIASKGREKAKQFAWDRVAAKVLDVYGEVLASLPHSRN